jgi:hypothetical protein
MKSSNIPSCDKVEPLFDYELLNLFVYPTLGNPSWNGDYREILFFSNGGGATNSRLILEVKNGDGTTSSLALPELANPYMFILPLHVKVTNIDDSQSFCNNSAFGLK